MKKFFSLNLILSIQIIIGQSPLSDRYHTYSDITDSLFVWDQNFSNNSSPSPYYPNSGVIYQLEEIGQSNVDALPIYAVKLSYNADQSLDKPKVLILGQCHAEEILGIEISMELIRRFLYPQEYPSDYQTLIGSLNFVEIWVVPTHNPEGLSVVHGWEEEGEWLQDVSFRKNKTDVNNNGIFDFDPSGYGNDLDGVDLNRNYDFNWIFGDPIGALDSGCAGNPSYISHYDYYRGDAPFSEKEIQAIRDFALEKNFLLSIAYHSSRSGCVAERVIYPWLWAGGKAAPDYNVISTLGQEIAELTPVEVGDGNYHHAASGSVKGNAHDWFYAKTGCIQYLIEVGTENMQPNNDNLIEDTVDRNMAGAFHLLRRAAGINLGNGPDKFQITGIVRDATTMQPITAEVEILEMSGPMLSPRLTDDFGRYRRLLYPGTFTLKISAFGYETQVIDDITPTSSNITELNIDMIPLNYFTLDLDINLPTSKSQDIEIFRYYEDQVEVLQADIINSFYWPEGEYDLLFLSDDIYPKKMNINLNSDTNIEVDLKWYDLILSDSFENLDNWNIVRGEWNIQDGVLFSQENLTYDSYHPLGPLRIDLSTPFYTEGQDPEEIAIKLLMKNELEWTNDTLFVDIFNDEMNSLNIYNNTGQNWSYHNEYIHAPINHENYYLSLGIKSDLTLGYRGLALDYLSILREISNGCVNGDFNHDGEVNILDVVSIVNSIIEENYLTGFQDCASDINSDEFIDILDVVSLLIDILENE